MLNRIFSSNDFRFDISGNWIQCEQRIGIIFYRFSLYIIFIALDIILSVCTMYIHLRHFQVVSKGTKNPDLYIFWQHISSDPLTPIILLEITVIIQTLFIPEGGLKIDQIRFKSHESIQNGILWVRYSSLKRGKAQLGPNQANRADGEGGGIFLETWKWRILSKWESTFSFWRFIL